MTNFRTSFKISGLPKIIDHNSKLFFIGSCFTESISKKLNENKYITEVNPFGILYNPVSVLNSLDFILDEKEFFEDDLFFDNSLWASFYHHGKFSDKDKKLCLSKINESIKNAYLFLQSSSFLFITFGTSRVYKLKETGKIVSNCHKLPSERFFTSFLDTDEIINDYEELLNKLISINPDLKIVFTISPVRHWQDGAVKNQLSKAKLIQAVHHLVESSENVYYFPSLEIMMDDLRDYRFYEKDMIHPNEIAIDYIWQKFSENLISDKSIELNKKIININKAFSHKVQNPDSAEYRSFKTKILEEINGILGEDPGLDFKKEIEYFKD